MGAEAISNGEIAPGAGRRELRVIVIGAGFGGVGTAIELQRHGFQDLEILDRAPSFGGTWLHNTYPGAACDVPSHLYSFSYAQRRDWSRICSPQQEILDYLTGVARDHGLERKFHPHTEVTACDYDDDRCRWTVRTAGGETYEADAIVIATGQLHRPARPSIPGADSFTGHSFHSAEWDHDYDLWGRRVAVVGTGASAVQFVPEIAPRAAHMKVFQRTGNWFMPRKNRAYPAAVKAAIKWIPGIQAFRRRFIFNYGESLTWMIRNPKTAGRVGHLRSALFMRSQLPDRELRAKVWPDYTFGCKRVLFSSHFLPALGRENVELITERITEVTPTGLRTADGVHHEVDCLIWSTGFRTNDFMFPMEITGAGGASLREHWAAGAHAHLGITVPGFPSMFLVYGPNTNTSGGSIVFYEEAQARYIRQALEHLRDAPAAAAIDVRADVEARFDAATQARFKGTAWTACDSWYRTPDGRIVANWPGYMREYESAVTTLDPGHFRLIEAPAREHANV